MATVNNIDIIVKYIDNATAGIKKTAGELESFAERNKNLFQSMVVGGTAAFGFLSLAIYKGRQDLNEYESVVNRLSHILQTATGATDEQVNSLIKQAEALELVGVASKESIINAQAQLATFDLQTETIEKLIPSITDYVMAEKGASATTADFSQMTNSLAQALNGNFGSLTRVGFVLDDVTKEMIENGSEMERATALASVLDSTYGGFNESLTKTSEGIAILRNRELRNLNQNIASGLMPTLDDLNLIFIDILQKVNTFIIENQELVLSMTKWGLIITGAVGVLGALGLALIPIIASIKSVIGVVKGLGTVLMFLTKNPIGIVIIALGLLAWGVYKIWKNWDTIKPKLIAFWEGIKNKINGLIDKVKKILVDFGEWIKPYAEILFFPLLLAMDLFTGNWEGGLDRIKEYAVFIWDLIKGIFNFFLDWVSPFGEKLNNAFGTMWENIKDSVLGIVTGLVDSVKGMFDGLLGFIGGTVDKAKGLASGIGNTVSGAVGKIGGFFGGERALGGPVSAGKTYLVGERGPELFTPGISGGITPNNKINGIGGDININFSNVVINTEADENRLVEKIKTALRQQANNYNLGIT